MSLVLPDLLLGGFEESFDRALLEAHGVTHVLNVADECNVSERVGRAYAKYGVPDDCPDADMRSVLDPALAFIRGALDSEGVTDGVKNVIFVHCLEGVSRSACVTLAYMVRCRGWSVHAALAHILARRPAVDPFPPYLRQTIEYCTGA
jgi:protein-tyrosine phosphatase